LHVSCKTRAVNTFTRQNQSFILSYLGDPSLPECTASKFDQSNLVECHEWIYDRKVYATSFMVEDNIVCGNSWKGPLTQSIFFCGVLVITKFCSIAAFIILHLFLEWFANCVFTIILRIDVTLILLSGLL
jgi:hypothetical protein